jgi:pimeloyl-ACP methyl ester carboxylesterase
MANPVIGHKLVGKGARKVIVLHGWFGDSSAFDPVLPFLDTANFTYAFMDYRGYGKSTALAGEHTMSEIAQDALNLADHLGWAKFSVIGHSMGGMAVQWLAVTTPDRVESIVGVTPVAACGFPMDPDTSALFRGAKDNRDNRYAILMHTTGNRLTPQFGQVMTERSLAQTTPDAFDDYLTAWSETNFSEQVHGLKMPFLVLLGEHDPAITAEAIEGTVLKWFPNATLDIIPNAGHYPMIETPVTLVTRWEAFLKSEKQVLSQV